MIVAREEPVSNTFQQVSVAKPPQNSPSPAELDVLAVLWDENQKGEQSRPLRLSEVHRRVCLRRRENQEPEPATTTISTQLRSLTSKELIREVMANEPVTPKLGGPSRGMLTPTTRSPLTAYEVCFTPSQILAGTMRGLGLAYPEHSRAQAVIDFALAVGLPEQLVQRIAELIRTQPQRPAQPTEFAKPSVDSPPPG